MKLRIVPFLIRLLIGLNGVDCGLTLAAVIVGYGQEMNPLMRLALGVSPWFFLATKLAIMELASVTMFRQYRKLEGIPWFLVILNALYLAVVFWNLHLTMVKAK
jgi:ABC-type xylose transport system permease subunit